MIDYGTCCLDNISDCDESVLDGIRVIFKKPKMHGVINYAEELMKKGYKITLQLVSITSYSNRDILDLVDLVNKIKPYIVSIVDTYGLMHNEESLCYFDLLDHNFDKDILLRYHTHNNFQLAYANTIEIIKQKTNRGLLIDGTVYGKGKAAGNAEWTEDYNKSRLHSFLDYLTPENFRLTFEKRLKEVNTLKVT